MKIVDGFPPNYNKIVKHFKPPPNAGFTYGEIIYCPGVKEEKIDDDFLVHEGVHRKQQGDNPEAWWDKYFIDPKFRLEQEIEAYRTQFKFYSNKNKSWLPFLKRIASDFSSPMYGNIISLQDAVKVIMQKAN